MNATTPAGFDEVGRIERLLLRRPDELWADPNRVAEQWRALNYLAAPDPTRALDEYLALVALLERERIALHYLPPDPHLTLDAIYVRDALVLAPGGVIACAMGKAARTSEPQVAVRACREWGIPVLGAITGDGRLEGGDVVWFDARTVAIGRSYRTNADGIAQLRRLLGERIEVVEVPLPHWRGPESVFHLMSILSPIDRDLALVYSPLMPIAFRERLLARGIELLEVPEDEFETLGCNVLALAPRRCLLLKGNPGTRTLLERAGVEVHEFEGAEIAAKGGGGPTCLTRPLVRGESA